MSTARLRQTTMRVTSAYGPRILNKKANVHKGTDFPFGTRDAVGSFGAGRVVFAGRRLWGHPDFERGLHVIVEHAPGILTSYHSASRLLVKTGDVVAMNQPLCYGGRTAVGATGDHCHIGLWLNGNHVDLEKYLTPGVVVAISNDGIVLGGNATDFDNTEDDMLDKDDMNLLLNTPAYTGGPTISALFKLLDSTPSKVAQAVWWESFVDRPGGDVAAMQELADAKTIAARSEARLVALSAALEALAVAKGVDPEKLSAMVAEKVDQALADNFAAIPDQVRTNIKGAL